MGQQPNTPLAIEDLPRPEPHPAPAGRWQAQRPGDPGGPGEVPWGGAFGTPGPDTGYALRLLAGRSAEPAGEERRADRQRALAVLMAARASRLGRAPVAADAEVAEAILGPDWAATPGGGAEGDRRLLEAISTEVLVASPDEVRRRAAAGERLIG